jgi:hypothetical protein
VQEEALLFAAAGAVENTGMGWNADRTSVGRRWGTPPLIAEGIPVVATVPGDVRVAALTPDGKRNGEVPVVSVAPRRSRVSVGAQYRTLWYLIEPRS